MKSNQTFDSGSENSVMLEETRKRNKLGFQAPTQLCDDLRNEIINRLPAKSNFRFKCVSKQWYYLNSEALKFKSQTLTMSGIFYNTVEAKRKRLSVEYVRTQKGDGKEDSSVDGTLSFLPEHHSMRIIDSCNGLLLCEGWDECDHSVLLPSRTSCLYVCNPATRKWVKILCNHAKSYNFMIIDFNPLVSVHFSLIAYGCFSTFEVFSSKSGEWRVSRLTDQVLREYQFHDYSTSIFKGHFFSINHNYTNVAEFDMEGNFCHKIDLPGKSHEKNNGLLGDASLFQSGGYLNYHYISGHNVYVWKLVDYETGSWLLRNSFPIINPMTVMQDFRFHPNTEEIFIWMNEELHSFNTQTTQVIDLRSFHGSTGYFPYSPCYLDGFGDEVESK